MKQHQHTRFSGVTLGFLFSLLLLQSNCIIVALAEDLLLEEEHYSPYWIVIDGGSTGSRLHVLEFVETLLQDDDDDDDDDDDSNDKDDEDMTTQLECVRRGSARANVPLSAFGRLHPAQEGPLNATHVAEHLLPAFVYAAEQIPAHYHSSTTVLYQATAGMRLLPAPEQEAVYDALYKGLLASPEFQFDLKRENIATLSGQDEGFYGAVAANYLHGTIDAELNIISASGDVGGVLESNNNNSENTLPIGALDMGGSSTQIVFLPGSHVHEQEEEQQQDEQSCAARFPGSSSTGSSAQHLHEDCHRATSEDLPSKLNGDDFFSTSYLSYGVDQFRERLWTTWVEEHVASLPEDACDAKVLENPCNFKGYAMEWMGYTMMGTGNTEECIQQVQRLIPHADEADHHHNLGRHVGGVPHPPVQGKFLAMSLYFFTLDALRELSHADESAHKAINLSWPTPSIAELSNALNGLCQRSWPGDLEEIQHNAHAFTRPEVLPYRCLEAVYMVTLLKDGFGFEPESRDITFAFLVDGSEVEWSLGMALTLRAQEQEERLVAATTTTTADERTTSRPRKDANATEKSKTATTSNDSRVFWQVWNQVSV